MTDFDNLIVSFKDSMNKTVLFVNGNDQTDILTATGPVPSLAKLIRRTDERLALLMPDISTRLWLDGDGQYSANQQAWGRRNLGLDKVDNVADTDKPVSAKQLEAIQDVLKTANSKEDPKNRNKAGGYFGYDGARLPIINGAETFYGHLYNNVTKRRDWLLPDEDGEIALKSHITGTNSGTNTGDETAGTIRGKLGIEILSGKNTGDETQGTILEKLELESISGVNTGDETQDSIIEKIGYEVMPLGARGAVEGVAPLDEDRLIPEEYLPPLFETIELLESYVLMPPVGVDKRLYITIDDSAMYYWRGGVFAQINARMENTNALPEGERNLYFTQLRAIEAVLSSYVAVEAGHVTADDKVVTAIGKLQAQITASIESYTQKLQELETYVNERVIKVTGDVTGEGTDQIELLIGPRKVTYGMMPMVGAMTIVGRNTDGAGNAIDLSVGQVREMLGVDQTNNTSDAAKPVSTAQKAALDLKEDLANKATDFSVVDDTRYPSVKAAKAYADSLIVGLVSDRGNYDASVNTFPATGGSGASGAILKGNLWYVNVPGKLGGVDVNIGDSFRALTDNPGQDASKWGVLESNIGYVPYNATNPAGYISGITSAMVTGALGFTPMNATQRDAQHGVVGMQNWRIVFRSISGAQASYFQNSNTTTRFYTFPDQSGTIALTSDITGINSGTNTGDETKESILAKLGSGTLSGTNTGDETKETILAKLGGETLTGVNTGDETKTTIESKLGGNLTLRGGAPELVLDENDISAADSKWRWVLDGGTLRLDMNSAAARDFSSYLTLLTFNKTGVTLAMPLKMSGVVNTERGSDLVVGNQLSMGNMSRNYGHLVGDGAVSLAPLADGNMRILRVMGTVQFNHSSSLVTPTGATLNCKAGDIVVLLGTATGTQIIDYIPSGGYNAPDTVLAFTATTATTTLDLSRAAVFEVRLSANTAFVFDFSKLPALESQLFSFVLSVTNDNTAGRGMSFPANVKWAGGAVPPRTTAANGRDDWYFYSRDGINWIGSLSNQDIR